MSGTDHKEEVEMGTGMALRSEKPCSTSESAVVASKQRISHLH